MSSAFGTSTFPSEITAWGTDVPYSQGSGAGPVYSNTVPADDNGLVVYDGTTGLQVKEFSGTGRPVLTAGVVSISAISPSEISGNANRTVTTNASTGVFETTKNRPTGDYLGTTDTQILSNKTITDPTNDVACNSLKTTGSSVNVSAAAPPTAGQVLKATSATTAVWSTDSTSTDQITGGGGTITVANPTFILYQNPGLLQVYEDTTGFPYHIVQRQSWTQADDTSVDYPFVDPAYMWQNPGYAVQYQLRMILTVSTSSMLGNVWEFETTCAETGGGFPDFTYTQLLWRLLSTRWSPQNVPNELYVGGQVCNFILDQTQLTAKTIRVTLVSIGAPCRITLDTDLRCFY